MEDLASRNVRVGVERLCTSSIAVSFGVFCPAGFGNAFVAQQFYERQLAIGLSDEYGLGRLAANSADSCFLRR